MNMSAFFFIRFIKMVVCHIKGGVSQIMKYLLLISLCHRLDSSLSVMSRNIFFYVPKRRVYGNAKKDKLIYNNNLAHIQKTCKLVRAV